MALHAGKIMAAGGALAAMACAREKPARIFPNVVIILADDLGYGDLGCYGARNVNTPNVDALAQQGMRFTHAYATASVSTPSRYSLLTGEYAWRRPDTDIARGDAGMIIRPGQYTLADLFKNEGYATAVFGKWHLGLGADTGKQDWNAPLPSGPGDIGFDESYIMAATGDRVPCVFIRNGRVVSWDPEAPIEVSYDEPFPGEPELIYNLLPTPGLGHNQTVVNGIGRIGYMKGGGRALWKDEDIADSITVHALNFIRKNKNRPFFIYLATNDIHVPRFPHQRFRGESGMGLRGDAIVEFDWTVGAVMDELEALGLAGDTILIVTSDNGPVIEDGYQDMAGELLGGHDPAGGIRGNKYGAYEAGTRVPLLVRWPGHVAPGGRSDALLSQIDLFAGFASMLGARVPDGAAPDSRNYLDAWLGENPVGREYVVEQAHNRTLSVRTAGWKYIEPSRGPEEYDWAPGSETGYRPHPQLFNLAEDPQEQHNVASDYPEMVARLQEVLTKERTLR